MVIRRKRLIRFFLGSALLLFSGSLMKIEAAEAQTASTEKAIVFLLDASSSMNNDDKNRMAIDSIAQLAYGLPSDYLVGVVAYNNQVVCTAGLADQINRSQVIQQAEAVSYTGYTNAGDGLSKAVELLGDADAIEKTIIIFSDGEIDMRTSKETEASLKQFETAVSSAVEQNIRIHVIGLGKDMEDQKMNIFSAAEDCGGIRIQMADAEDIPSAIETILGDQLHIKKTTGALMNASGDVDNLSVSMPFRHAGKVRILLTSTGEIQNIIADFHGSDAKQFIGNYYAVIEITNPTIETINFQIKGADGSRIKVDIIPEYKIIAIPEQLIDEDDPIQINENMPEQTEEAVPMQIQRFCVRFYDSGNPNQQVFTDAIFENRPLNVKVGNELIPMVLTDGMLTFELSLREEQSLPMSFDFTDMPVTVLNNVTGILDVKVKAVPPKPDMRPRIIIGIAAAVLMIAIFILLLRRSKKIVWLLPASSQTPPVPESKYSYTGRLSIFITKTASGQDVPTLSYNLFRLSSGREITLQKILEGCGVKEQFAGAEKILFQPGARLSLILTNQSDCTILRNREILLKGKSFGLPMNSKVDITFEDERSELTFQYKDLK